VTLGDADFRKSLMKMIYRKLPKTASLPVTCHPLGTYLILCLDGKVRTFFAGLVSLKCQRAPHLGRKNEWLGSGIEVSVVQTPRESSLFGQARE
jgi:hypothetical protein